ncbi:MAG: hypothetical protein A3H91_14020 [Gammaproteobacteria bacterium RIFCSPLOWO2_02_FULL_61_13]|nr:MAG: hypothetical protein A3H91_14020 [Gammaproteobacteria bacterium RIFCSPLOWO2_02_FULL_61_13]
MNNFAALTLGALLVISGQALAENEPDAQKDIGRMERKLDLSPDQTQKVRTIMQEQADKRRALEEETKKRLSTVLNAEQMERLEQHADRRDGRRGERMAEELDLTPEQKESVGKIFSETRAEHDAMDKSNLDRDQKRAQMDALHARTRDKLAKVLNEDQLARFDEMHSRHMSRGEKDGGHQERRQRRSSDAGPVPDDAAEPDAD